MRSIQQARPSNDMCIVQISLTSQCNNSTLWLCERKSNFVSKMRTEPPVLQISLLLFTSHFDSQPEILNFGNLGIGWACNPTSVVRSNGIHVYQSTCTSNCSESTITVSSNQFGCSYVSFAPCHTYMIKL